MKVYRAPGRVNLIGEHTDYNEGFVMPVALSMECRVAVAPNDDGVLRMMSKNFGETREYRIDALPKEASNHWSDYIVGVALEVGDIRAIDLTIESTVPVGSGLSSSAALLVATALALLDGRPMEKLALAQLCQRAEREFIGLPVGLMDHFISVHGVAGAAVRLDCRDYSYEIVPLPVDAKFVIVNSLVKHSLAGSAYRDRVRECAEAARELGVASLRDVTGVPANKRARHVVTENARVLEFAHASTRRRGELMYASHASLRDDYEVSCEELDFLVDASSGIPGVYGARMTGGGFGGSIVALIDAEAETRFRRELGAQYESRFGLQAEFYPCIASEGAGLLNT